MKENIKPTDDHLLVLQADEETEKGGNYFSKHRNKT